MIELVRFEPEHWTAMQKHGIVNQVLSMVNESTLTALAAQPHSYTMLVDGEPMLCGGAIAYWPDRAEVWAVLSVKAKPHFLALHNATRRFLDVVPFTRLEAVVVCDFKEGHRWMKALGFKLEAERMARYAPDGSDCALYARVT